MALATIDQAARRKVPFGWWKRNGDWLIAQMEQHRSVEEIAAAAGTTTVAVRYQIEQRGLRFRDANGRTLTDVARLMGIEWHVVAEWADKGWLKCYRVGHLRIVEHEDLTAFMEDESHWHEWEPSQITDIGLREWATEIRRGLVFYTTAEAGRILGFVPSALSRAIKEGRLRGVWGGTKKGGRWMIRSDWLVIATPKKPIPGPKLSDAAIAVISEKWGSVPGSAIAHEIGASTTTVANWARRLGLAGLGRGYWRKRR
jgi:hypothetical protein